MPYTNPWSDTIPLGSAPANTIDDRMRQLRLDVHERMNDVVVDWETDPVVPKAAIGTGINGVGYDDDQAAGSKALDYGPIVSVLNLYFIGETSVGGIVVINLNEVNTFNAAQVPPVVTNWQVGNIHNPHVAPPGDTFLLPISFVGRSSASNVIGIRQVTADAVANTITLMLDNVGTFAGTKVRFWISFGFTVAP